MRPHEILARPLELPCGVTLPNRIAKAAMTEQMAGPDNEPNENIVRLYDRWSRGGAGLLVTGNVMVAARSLEHPANVVIEDDRHLDCLSAWANAAAGRGVPLWMQISHAGRQCPRSVSRRPVAPSPVPMQGVLRTLFAKPRALTVSEIRDIIERFGRTAAIAQRAGFAGVQVHSAHGYLGSQFLSPLTNRRDDEWGGSLENRMRFLLEVVRTVRGQVGPRFPVGVKLNAADFQYGGFSEDESVEVAKTLAAEHIDLLEVSGGNYENPAMMQRHEKKKHRGGFFMTYAARVRKEVDLPLMLTGGFRSAEGMAAAIESGSVDVIGAARPIAVNPDFPAALLSESIDEAQSVRTTVGIKLLDDMLQSYWYNTQMRRMAQGLEPNPNLGRVYALSRGLWSQAIPKLLAPVS